MRRVETTSSGNVSAVLAFSLRSFCDDSDFENYPDDVYKCCFSLEPQSNPVRHFFIRTPQTSGVTLVFQDIIEFDASGLPIFTDPKYFRDYGWKVSGTVPQSLEDPAQVAQVKQFWSIFVNLKDRPSKRYSFAKWRKVHMVTNLRTQLDQNHVI